MSMYRIQLCTVQWESRGKGPKPKLDGKPIEYITVGGRVRPCNLPVPCSGLRIYLSVNSSEWLRSQLMTML